MRDEGSFFVLGLICGLFLILGARHAIGLLEEVELKPTCRPFEYVDNFLYNGHRYVVCGDKENEMGLVIKEYSR